MTWCILDQILILNRRGKQPRSIIILLWFYLILQHLINNQILSILFFNIIKMFRMLVTTAWRSWFISPMFVDDATPNKDPFDDQEDANSAYKDKRDDVLIGILALICLWKYVNHGVAYHSPTAEPVEHIDNHFECLFCDKLL